MFGISWRSLTTDFIFFIFMLSLVILLALFDAYYKIYSFSLSSLDFGLALSRDFNWSISQIEWFSVDLYLEKLSSITSLTISKSSFKSLILPEIISKRGSDPNTRNYLYGETWDKLSISLINYSYGRPQLIFLPSEWWIDNFLLDFCIIW